MAHSLHFLGWGQSRARDIYYDSGRTHEFTVVTFVTIVSCFVQAAQFLALLAVIRIHSVVSLWTEDEKSLYFGLEGGKYLHI